MSRFNGYYDNFSRVSNPKGYLGDFAHASALYVRNDMRLAPKVKFLYHVVINVNSNALATLGPSVVSLLNKREFNLLVQSAGLPGYSITTDTKNAYNRKRVYQTKMDYNPVDLIFHDDNAGLTSALWEAYFRYYNQDPNYATQNIVGNPNTTTPYFYAKREGLTYSNDVNNIGRFGLDKSIDYPFFDSITINQLHPQGRQSTYTSITLVNPMITSFEHDTVDQTASNGIMKNTMRLEYEAVLYGRDETSVDAPAGFADASHYDVTPSPLATPNNTNIGIGGLIEAFLDLFFDAGNTAGNFDVFQNQRQNQNILNTATSNFSQEFLNLAGVGLRNNQINFGTNFYDTNTVTFAQSLSTALPNTRSTDDIVADITATDASLDNAAISGLINGTLNSLRGESTGRNAFERNMAILGNINDAKSAYNSLPESTKQSYRNEIQQNARQYAKLSRG